MSKTPAGSDRPNILLIVTDQQRRDAIRAYGNPLCPTPHLERLAREGVRFDHAFTCTALCGPARASLFTGLMPHNHGVVGNSEKLAATAPADIAPGVPVLTDYLKTTPYIPYLIGKWHAEETRVPSDFGFRGHDFKGYGHPGAKLWRDFTFPLAPWTGNPYRDWLAARAIEIPAVRKSFQGNNPGCQNQELYGLLDAPEQASIPWFLAEETIRSIDEAVRERRPFFSWVNFWGPHTPCVVPEPYFSMVEPASIPEDPAFRETFEGKPEIQRIISRMWGLHDFDWSVWREIVARYYGYIIQIDAMIGRILAHLESRGILDNTVVIFASDHGDAMGAHKLIEKGEFMYDEAYRVPLIVRHPLCERPGTTTSELVYFHDLFPTVLEIAGSPAPAVPDSASFLPLLLGRAPASSRQHVYGQFTRHFVQFNQRMIRTRTHKLIWNTSAVSEMYDLESDPHEMRNRFNDPACAGKKRELLDTLEKEMARLGDPLVEWLRRVSPIL